MSDERTEIITQNNIDANDAKSKTFIDKENTTTAKPRPTFKERVKNSLPSFKKAIPVLLVALIGFGAGIGTDRLFMHDRMGKNSKNTHAVGRNASKGSFKNGNFNRNNNNGSVKKGNGPSQQKDNPGKNNE